MTSPPAPSPLPGAVADPNPPILFRPSKKRKLYRQREREASPPPGAADAEEKETTTTQAAASIPAAQSLDELIASGGADADATPSLAEILRLRKQRRARAAAVEGRYGHAREGGEEEMEGEGEGGLGDEGSAGAGNGVVRRFAPQTGVVGRDDVDRHMMAYIDSELAKRRQLEGRAHQAGPDAATTTTTASTTSPPPARADDAGRGKPADVQREPAALGKLLEIDLGDEARDRNVLRTEQARRRMGGEVVEDDEAAAAPAKGKVRLGRDGKPWRGRKRRGSEDIKRDKLVEDFLRENRLDNIYDEAPPPAATTDDDRAADDALAEAFRKEFMDAVSQRQRKKAAPAQPAARGPGGKREEELKGPKLGGSRSARAAMREALLKNAKK